MRYADPSLCPDCRSDLPAGVPVCPTCSLLVRHPLAVDLFRTLRRADGLVAQLRTTSERFRDRPVGAPPSTTRAIRTSSLGGPILETTPAPKRAVAAGGTATLLAPTPGAPGLVPPGPAPAPPPAAASGPVPPRGPLPPYPTPGPAPHSPGLDLSSVPKVLLGLGAFCLLVAALIFLAVAWSSFGIGARTAILGGLTLVAGGSAFALHRIGLRIAGEALVVVALGLVFLDVLGAGAAGWFGTLSGGAVTAIAGLVLALAGTAAGLLRVGGQPRLVAPQVIAGIGLAVAHLGGSAATGHRMTLAHGVTVLALALAVLGRRRAAAALAWSAAAAGGLAWLAGASLATTEALADPSLHRLWVDGAGWSLLVSAALLLAPGVVLRHHALLLAGAGCAAMILTGALTLPCVDTDTTTVGLVAVLVTGAWVAALALLPNAVRPVAIAPAGLGSLILLGLSLTTAGVALARWLGTGDGFTAPADVVLGSPEPVTEPLLLMPSLVVVLAFLALLSRGRVLSPVWLAAGGLTLGLGLATTLASYDLALALPLTVLLLVALGGGLLSLRTTGGLATAAAVVAVAASGLATLGASPSTVLTALVASIAAVLVVALASLSGRQESRIVAGLASAPLLATAAAAIAYQAGGDAAWIAIPVLLAVGVLAVVLPRIEVEVPAVVVAVLTLPISLEGAAQPSATASLWLAVAGFVCCATATIHDTRRWCLGLGGGLLLLATWVRLADLQVQEPEAYTLPLAVALLAVGLWRMRAEEAADSMTSLLPGLLLATVPSLLWVLSDPFSLRALLLGGACLALTVAGSFLRWSALLLVGSVVGTVLVLREIGPYSGDFPTWVWIGLAGLLLTTVGITWERRLLEVRKAIGFLGRLR